MYRCGAFESQAKNGRVVSARRRVKIRPVSSDPKIVQGAFGSGYASKIAPGLWQGGYPVDPQDARQAGFSTIVLCAKELQMSGPDDEALFEGLRVINAPLDDRDGSPSRDEVPIAVEAANRVVEDMKAGKHVLVTCAQGRNRSGLVCALVLISWFGIDGREAVKRVKAARPKTLTNPTIAEFLEKVPRGGKIAA